MGGRPIPAQGVAAKLACVALGLAASGCFGGSDGDDTPATPTEGTPEATATRTATPRATATPDPLGTLPATTDEAIDLLLSYFGARPGALACPPQVTGRWGAECATGDADGDGATDLAILLPGADASEEASGVGLLFLAASQAPERFPSSGSADLSELGRGFFALEDRTGDGRADLALLATSCSATACAGQAQVWWWDGLAFRDGGPGSEEAVVNLLEVVFDREGGESVLISYGGKLEVEAAGPTRNVRTAYLFDGARYVPILRHADEAEYLYHAVVDADALFDAGDWEAAIAGYGAALGNAGLKDWKFERNGADGRSELEGYARLRIAIAKAAARDDPTAALDATILNHPGTAFGFAAETFRTEYQQTNEDVQAACRAVTTYLGLPPIPDVIRATFDYGYANPVRTFEDICPL